MRVVRIVYSGLRVVHCAYGIACINWVMRVIFWCNVIHDSKSRGRLELFMPPHPNWLRTMKNACNVFVVMPLSIAWSM